MLCPLNWWVCESLAISVCIMTSQRRRPEQTQRRLAIQASSRRSRVAAPASMQNNAP